MRRDENARLSKQWIVGLYWFALDHVQCSSIQMSTLYGGDESRSSIRTPRATFTRTAPFFIEPSTSPLIVFSFAFEPGIASTT